MTFPKVESIAKANYATSTQHNISLPSGLVAGDILVVFFAYDSSSVLTINEVASGPSFINAEPSGPGWVVKYEGWGPSIASIWKVFEEGDELVIDLAASQKAASIAYRISGATGCFYPATANASGVSTSNTAWNPPALDCGTADDYLWLTGLCVNQNGPASAAPTNYTNLQTQAGLDSGGAALNYLMTAQRELKASSDDPGGFTAGGSARWRGNTIAVIPAPEPWSGPEVRSVKKTEYPASASHEIVLPEDTEVGDLIVVFFANETKTSFLPDTFAGGEGVSGDIYINEEPETNGWAWYWPTPRGDGPCLNMAWKIAEGGDRLVVKNGPANSLRAVSIVYSIKKASRGTYYPDISYLDSKFTNSGTSVNPPELDLTVAKNYLWLMGFTHGHTLPLALSAGYENIQSQAGPTSGFGSQLAGLVTAQKELKASSEDPAAFTINQGHWAVITMAVLPMEGLIHVWDGSKWVLKPVRYWDGTSWKQKPIAAWDGSEWVTN